MSDEERTTEPLLVVAPDVTAATDEGWNERFGRVAFEAFTEGAFHPRRWEALHRRSREAWARVARAVLVEATR